MRAVRLLALVAALPAWPIPLSAHHSHPNFYDACRKMTMKGGSNGSNSRTRTPAIFLKLDDGTVYNVDCAPLSRLTSSGVIDRAKEALVNGARIAMTSNPMRETVQIQKFFPDFKGPVNPNTIDSSSIRRIGDGWSWTGPRGECR